MNYAGPKQNAVDVIPAFCHFVNSHIGIPRQFGISSSVMSKA